ncbi:MAG TPA: histidine phosphotransferase family protein [Stellaceae bacterium]|nr:histidine phosphotransferase family protein [Stellaceae bacterium]
MTGTVAMHVLELLTARLCHELIGPIAAVNNGVEILAEGDTDFAADAVQLVGDSARRAGTRLQFYRFAYGFAPRRGFSGPPPHELAGDYFATTRIACDYDQGARSLPLEWQKLACNLLLVGAEALPRGGSLRLRAGPAGPELTVSGGAAGLAPEVTAALGLVCPVAELSTRTVQGYFTGLLARDLGCRLFGIPAEPEGFRLAAAGPEVQAVPPPPTASSFVGSGARDAPISGIATGSRKT